MTRWPDPLDLRLSFGDTFLLARSFSDLLCDALATRSGDLVVWTPPIGTDRDSSLGVVNFAPPSTSMSSVHSRFRPLLVRATCLRGPFWGFGLLAWVFDLRPGVATLRTRSVPVVPPDFDGLLRWTSRRFVAPCSRPWGSPRFRAVGLVFQVVHWEPPFAQPRLNLAVHRGLLRQMNCERVLRRVRPARHLPRVAHTRPGPFPVAQHPSKLSPRLQPCHVTVVIALSPLVPIYSCRRRVFP